MKKIQRILVLMVLTIFASSTIANAALAACNCDHMQADTAAMEMPMDGDIPCHGTDKADSDTKSDSNKMAGCDGCGCGDCHIPATAALPNQLAQNQIISTSKNMMPASDFMKSLFPYGIDYPPKRIS